MPAQNPIDEYKETGYRKQQILREKLLILQSFKPVSGYSDQAPRSKIVCIPAQQVAIWLGISAKKQPPNQAHIRQPQREALKEQP